MNAVPMVARCMVYSEPSSGEGDAPRWTREDLAFVSEKLKETAIPEEPMGYPGAA